MRGAHRREFLAGLAALPLALGAARRARAEDAAVIDYKVDKALAELRAQSPEMRELLQKARGVLVMPEITKAGFLIGGAYGEGALRINGVTVDYYAVAAASFGLQAGVQRMSQALLFMTTAALEKFRRSEGWELGADAQVVTPEDGLQAGISTTTARHPVIEVVFGERGIMAGLSLEGAKYTRIKR
ncbi:YSC84-related protein [Oceanicella actignis]|uniref:Lipid-binding SYLF domain-containing protein n=1 Tax=Oceanicella actignis TaxID=1189325 RepID=A0A1M7S8I8_9RHOB|nr:YSC84-related protein [Oceanicella actignis]SET31918.1 Lipid-binding SYLF domain-containing protein [Oceanicella actignis]SHN54897.1 Lipid-binding SYLF domain-containing protein [Oceanicella actignis]